MMRLYTQKTIFLTLLLFCTAFTQIERPVKIGSKKFTESVILGELTAQLIQSKGYPVTHREELGGTRVLWSALIKGDIDIYPEYTGTIIQEIFAGRPIENEKQLREALSQHNIKMSGPLGFNNTYALGMKEHVAEKYHITKISDLQKYPQLKFGFTSEFMDRADGWPNLQQHYQLPQQDVRGLDHDLAYRGIESGAIDVIDIYSTDAEIEYYNLRVLKDDNNYFTEYKAVYLYRNDLNERAPGVVKAELQLENRIPESSMVQMNAAVKLKGISEKQVASNYLENKLYIHTKVDEETIWTRLWRNTKAHLFLVAVSLTAAILLAIPLGIIAFKVEKLGQIILGIVGVIQIIPSLAIIVFMIPLMGIGAKPAIVALFLYSLLPIVRNTFSGLNDIPSPISESAIALGLAPFARLRLIELPLASRSILAGIKTSAIINIGTATLGALIGAGGYGQPILTGIRLDNIGLILEGAVPAALLALAAQGLFELVEIILVPKGLRIKAESG